MAGNEENKSMVALASKASDVDAMLAELGLSTAKQKEYRALCLSLSESLTIDEMRALLVHQKPPALSKLERYRRWLSQRRVRFSVWWSHRSGLLRLVYAAAWLGILWKALVTGLTWYSAGFAAVILGLKLKAVMAELSPQHLQLFERNHRIRRIAEFKRIQDLGEWISNPPRHRELERFQQEVIELIVNYVRDHRVDFRGAKVFANLMIPDGDDVVVITRSDPQRPCPARYPLQVVSVAARVLATGTLCSTGRVYADHPDTLPDKPYKSILALPIRANQQTIGVVSLDSEVECHFDSWEDELAATLMPYTQFLSIALQIRASLPEEHDV
jgi:hypothetical protein